jgi:plasmid stabilization system protein ParE
VNYAVFWTQEAYESLLDVASVLQVSEQVVRAVEEIHRLLAENPDQQGESRPGGRRIMFAAPIGVIYRMDARLRWVVISKAWGYLPRSR